MKTKRRTSVQYEYSFVNTPASKPLVVYMITVLSRMSSVLTPHSVTLLCYLLYKCIY